MTTEQLTLIPEVYRDTLILMKPIIDTHRTNSIVKVTAIPFGQIHNSLSVWHGYV